jgi:hypothetical protein
VGVGKKAEIIGIGKKGIGIIKVFMRVIDIFELLVLSAIL